MKLSHITIHGFKSFAKKTTLDVTRQVTGVVGPNGSGKSNVAEAIRFVLGEQSMKSMRGKVGPDLIFKGSERLPPMSRASVMMVIDNRDRGGMDMTHASQELAPYLVYDELVLSRILYADGTSDYTLNDAKVRLKDVQELLSFAGIGGSAHTIINQGEADKILLANPRERKEALEDALGLRVYHMRLNESTRKLEKVKVHLHEVDLLRKEIAPHLQHLKRQVEKLESKEKERKQLHAFLSTYLFREEKELHNKETSIREAGTSVSLSLIADSIKKELHVERKEDTQVLLRAHEKETLQAEMQALSLRRDELTKTLGRLEAEKAYLEKEIAKEETSKDVTIPHTTLVDTHASLSSSLSSAKHALSHTSLDEAGSSLNAAIATTTTFFTGYTSESNHARKEVLRQDVASLIDDIATHEARAVFVQNEYHTLEAKRAELFAQSEHTLMSRHEEEKKHLLLESKLRELESTIALRKQEEADVASRRARFDALLAEGVVIVGKEVLGYKEDTKEEVYMKLPMYELLRSIERSKLRIEEAGIPNAAEVIAEYTTTKEREEYLTRELADIRDSEEKLLLLINELQHALKDRFTSGVKYVSETFTAFFGEIFNGGKAKLTLISMIKVDEDGEEREEQGVDIEVKLPSKKVQELAMFSGGERALVSIALLFAMSSLTPPPFMVLDETDAPLDEHNAQKYGLLLKRLAEKSKLLVITHNRETMNHCDMLYGVTIGVDGGSKLLSIDFKQSHQVVE